MELSHHLSDSLRDFFYDMIAYLHSIALGILNLYKFTKKKMIISAICALKLNHAAERGKV